MAEIRTYPGIRHLRSEPTVQTLRFKKGKVVDSGRGLSFWFKPMNTAVVEIPLDDRDLPFVFSARTSDYQGVSVTGAITYRVDSPNDLSNRIDFTISLTEGGWKRDPLDQLSGLLTQLAQQGVQSWMVSVDLATALDTGVNELRDGISAALDNETALPALGLELVAVRVSDVTPDHEMERMLQTPARELVQNKADEAVYVRRTQAVEQERAIGEEQQKTELRRTEREGQLIEQSGANNRKQAEEAAAASKLTLAAQIEREKLQAEASDLRLRQQAEAQAAATKIEAATNTEVAREAAKVEAERVEAVEGAKVKQEEARIALHADAVPAVLLAEAARELGGTLRSVEHLTITPELLTPILERLGTNHKD